MSMIEYSLNALLPDLAWVATVEMPSVRVRVTHGRYVETQSQFFLEGAWAGNFDAGRLDATEAVFGSGAMIVDEGVLFVSSLATTDYLFYKRLSSSVIVANSLALLLAVIDDKLEPAFRGYADIINSILRGIDEYERTIPTRSGSVSRLMHHNLRIHDDDVDEIAKPESPNFSTYHDYASYLSSTYSALVENARDPRRRLPLKIYSTQSRGYDTTAVNSIAAKHGLDGVFTVTTGKGGGAFADQPGEPEVDDDGTEIARALGITTISPVVRRAFKHDYADEIYYYASVHEPQDANLKQVAEVLAPPALLLTGTLGELWYTNDLWYREYPECLKPDLRRGDLGLHGLTELRIRAGFVQAAVPYLGARRRSDILAITESSEMEPWRLGTAYDRPIPRRLGEEAGVPRSAFGQVKIGSVVEFTNPQIPQGTELRAGYFRFLKEQRLLHGWQIALFPLVHKINRTMRLTSETRYRLLYYSYRLVSKLRRKDIRPKLVWTNLRGSLHCFAVNQCATQYGEILRLGHSKPSLS